MGTWEPVGQDNRVFDKAKVLRWFLLESSRGAVPGCFFQSAQIPNYLGLGAQKALWDPTFL